MRPVAPSSEEPTLRYHDGLTVMLKVQQVRHQVSQAVFLLQAFELAVLRTCLSAAQLLSIALVVAVSNQLNLIALVAAAAAAAH